MSIHETMYKVALAERDYERHIVTILRADLEILRTRRRDLEAEVERWRNLALTAEKWRGLALAKGGDGRVASEIQAIEFENETLKLELGNRPGKASGPFEIRS